MSAIYSLANLGGLRALMELVCYYYCKGGVRATASQSTNWFSRGFLQPEGSGFEKVTDHGRKMVDEVTYIGVF